MKEQEFLEALGGLPQEMLDELADWQSQKTPITGKLPEKILKTGADTAKTDPQITVSHRWGRGKRPERSIANLLPWTAGIGAAMVACTVAAVSIGKEVIGQNSMMMTGTSVGTSIAEELSQREPIKIEHFCADGCKLDAAPALPESGNAEILHSLEDAQPWIENLRQNSVLFETSPLVEMLQNEKQYQDYDVIMTAVPFSFVYDSCGVAEYGFTGGTITPDGKLTAEFSFVTVGMDLHYLLQPQIETLCCCFAVPKGSIPEITEFAFNPVIYDCTAPLPDDLVSRDEQTEYYFALPNRQEYVENFSTPQYLYWAEDETKTADAAHEPVEIIDRLIVCGGNDSTMMKLPPEGAVQVLRNVEDAEACCQYSDENVAGQPFDFRNKLTEDVFAQYDVLYFAFKDEQYPQNCYQFELAGGSIAEDGTTLKLDFHALMFEPEHLPAHWCKETEPDWNGYHFYTVPKNTLPELSAIELNFEEYPIGEIPDEILAHANDLVDIEDNGYITKHTKLQEYLETTQEYLDWIMSMPKPKYITWAGRKADLPEDCEEVQPDAETLPEPFEAWYWVNFKGNSIPLDGITVDLIRTEADGEKYLTFAQQGNLESETYRSLSCDLSKGWLETGKAEDMPDGCDTPDGTPHDMLFIGMPADKMPHNTVKWAYHNGTVTPSGKLHLDFSALTLRDEAAAPLNYEFADDTNFYFFISIPEDAIPELTGWDVTFSNYSIGALPDYETAAAPDEITENGMTRAQCWIGEQPEEESYWDSVLCGKYITPIPEQQPDTVTVTGSYMVNAKNVSPELADEAPTVRFVDNFDGGNIDEITMILPVYDYDAATALRDLRISEDGTLSVTLCEYYDKHGIDRTQDTAWVIWQLYVPHGSLPKPKALNLTRADFDKWNLDENFDNMGFIHVAGQLCTVTME